MKLRYIVKNILIFKVRSIKFIMAYLSLEKITNNSSVTTPRFNGEETEINEILEKCKPILEEYYDSIQPRPETEREKLLALQIELGKSWTPHPENSIFMYELMFLNKRGNVYYPNEQHHYG